MQPKVPHPWFQGYRAVHGWRISVELYILCVIMRLYLKGFKVKVLQDAKKLHPGGIYSDAVTSFKEMNRFY